MLGAAVADADEDFDVNVGVLVLEARDGFGGDLAQVPGRSENAVGGGTLVVVVAGEGQSDLVLLQEFRRHKHLRERVVERVLPENRQHCAKRPIYGIAIWVLCQKLPSPRCPYILHLCPGHIRINMEYLSRESKCKQHMVLLKIV